jgi:pimeloyl-ACP methyl ester carboxylesterase
MRGLLGTSESAPRSARVFVAQRRNEWDVDRVTTRFRRPGVDSPSERVAVDGAEVHMPTSISRPPIKQDFAGPMNLPGVSLTNSLLTFLTAIVCVALVGCPGRSITVPDSHFVRGPGKHKLIIFVHGVLGDMDNTWVNQITHASWPQLIVEDQPDFSDYDVFVYGYASPLGGHAANIYELATRFGQQMKDWNLLVNYDEVDFVTHSMGGLITKRMLDTLNTPTESVNLHRVRSVIYIAVPTAGADIAALASWISDNPQFKSMSTREASDFLQSVEGDWQSLLRSRTAFAPFPRNFSAYETKPTHHVNVVPSLYTSQVSDAPVLGFDYDHIDIVKPPDRGNDVYRWVKARILESSRYPVDKPSDPLGVGHVVLLDAFKDFAHSGFDFRSREVVAWDSGRADILVSNQSTPQPLAFLFTQENAGGIYQNAPADQGSNGGIIKMMQHNMADVNECPASGYLSHWFLPEQNGIYCVRARDGVHFAKVQVTDHQQDRIAVDYVFQPAASRSF